MKYINVKDRLPVGTGVYMCRYRYKNDEEIVRNVLTFEKVNGEDVFTNINHRGAPQLIMSYTCDFIEWLDETCASDKEVQLEQELNNYKVYNTNQAEQIANFRKVKVSIDMMVKEILKISESL